MKLARLAAILLLVFGSFGATSVAPTKSELENMYDKAFREFDANNYDAALKALDEIDARQPDLAESLNLRGVVLMRKGDYDKAEAALRKALEIEPKFWNASFNLAEIPFLKKDWAEARNRFEALVAGNSDEMRGETRLLIQYKILLTFVMQGRENMVDWIINKFEGDKDSPALYYANAALALHHNNQKEAKDWMDAAAKHYSPQLNKLFAESFYEIGWMEKPAGESRAAVEITSTAERAERMKADAQANYERAERAFQQRDFPATLKFLDLADEGAPSSAASHNLRGEVFMEQKKFDDAEEEFRKAYTADPKFREAQYNLAQIPFKKKDYAKSRERLEALFGETPGGETNQAAQLIKYKIYMTLLLEGNDAQAQKMMDQFKFTGDTPALYYAQAAWSFKHGDADQGNDWINSARKIYSPALNIVFADTFYDLGWLKRSPETAAPPTTALAQANAAPANGPKPAMRFGEADGLPAPAPAATAQNTETTVAAASTPAPAASTAPATAITSNGTVVPATAASNSGTNAVAATTATAAKATPAPALANAVATPAAPTANAVSSATAAPVAPKPAATAAQTTIPAQMAKAAPAASHVPATSVTNSAQPIAKNSASAAATKPAPSPLAKTAAAAPLTAHNAVTPAATALEPARVRELSQPTFAEITDHIAEPRNLLFGVFLLGGLGILVWLFVQQVRRRSGSAEDSVYETSLPLTEPRFAGPGVMPSSERRISRAELNGGPPKLSLQLKGSEPTVRGTVRPSGAVGSRPVAAETSSARPTMSSPNEPGESVSEVKEMATPAAEATDATAASATPQSDEVAQPTATEFRDDEAASLAAAPVDFPATTTLLLANRKSFAPEEEPVAETSFAPVPEETPEDEVASLESPTDSSPASAVPTEAEEPLAPVAEPVAQGQPIPHLTATAPVEPEVVEPAEPVTNVGSTEVTEEPASTVPAPEMEISSAPAPVPAQEIEALEEAAAAAVVAPVSEPQSAIETPSFASKIITTEPTTTPTTTPIIMPEPTPITAINEPRPAAAQGAQNAPAAATGGSAPASASMQTAVQLTFSLEIASLQLTPTFKMGSLQLKPISKIVSMRLAPSAQPQPAMNLQVTFELSSLQLGAGASLGTVRLTPSSAQRPTPITTPSFEISGLQLVSSSASAPVQLTPTHQAQASVLMTANFQIATVEFSPSFEIASVVLNSTSKNVAVQLPGAGPSAIEAAPVFEIGNVQLSGNNELGLIQLNPLGGSGRRG